MEFNKLFSFWKTHSMRTLNLVFLLLAIFAAVVSKLSNNPNLLVASNLLVLIAILHFFLHGYFFNQHRFLHNYTLKYSLPKKKIRRIGGMYFSGFLIFVCVGMAVMREIYSGTLLAKIRAMFLYILKQLFGAIFQSDGLGKDELIIQQNYSLLGVMTDVAKKEDSAFEGLIDTLQSLLIIMGITVIVIVIIAAVVTTVRRLIQGVRVDNEGARAEQTFDTEVLLKESPMDQGKPFDFSPAARIRRTYRKAINRHRGRRKTILTWMTPEEVERHAGLPEDAAHKQLHILYEKARYSETGCTVEDLQLLKAMK